MIQKVEPIASHIEMSTLDPMGDLFPLSITKSQTLWDINHRPKYAFASQCNIVQTTTMTTSDYRYKIHKL